MALLLGALLIQGVPPGPQMITQHKDIFWGLIASMWVGNAMLIFFNLPMVGIWVKMLTVPYRLLSIAILFFCCIGTYSVNNNLDDIFITAVFGLGGYLCMRLDLDAAPLMLGFILGPLMEENLRRAMLLSRGDPMVFVQRPISAVMLGVCVLLLLSIVRQLQGCERTSPAPRSQEQTSKVAV